MTDLVFCTPMTPWERMKVDSKFLDNSYFRELGKWHHGWDINLNTGGDTDLGWPVRSIFPGTVVEVGNYRSWGVNVRVKAPEWLRVLAEDKLRREISSLEANYCHLMHETVKVGDVLDAGFPVGAVGKGDKGQYLAHLHFELRTSALPANYGQGSTLQAREFAVENFIDPALWFRYFRHSDTPNVLPQRRLVQPVKVVNLNGREYDAAQAVVNLVGNKLWVRTEREEA